MNVNVAILVAALAANSALASVVTADPPAASDTSVSAEASAYLSSVHRVAFRVHRKESAVPGAIVEAVASWLPGVELVDTDDADVIVEYSASPESADSWSAHEWRTVSVVEEGIRRPPADVKPDRSEERAAEPIPARTIAEIPDHPEGISVPSLPAVIGRDGSEPVARVVDPLPLPAGEPGPGGRQSVQWSATLFRLDCQSAAFGVRPSRPVEGRCERPVFVRVHVASLKGVAHDKDDAVDALGESLRELILGLPKQNQPAQE